MTNSFFESGGADEHLETEVTPNTKQRRSPSPLIEVQPEAERFRPVRKTEGSIGYDCFANLHKATVINPGRRATIPLGFTIEARKGYGLLVTPKSGLALNYGISVLNSPGLVDSDYPGEVKAIVINLGQEKFAISPGEAICQIIPTDAGLHQVGGALTQENLRQGGFGSTSED